MKSKYKVLLFAIVPFFPHVYALCSDTARPTVNWIGCIKQNVNLAGANLNGATLLETNLSNANLAGASLNGANLTGANLSGANLTGANLSGAIWTNGKICQPNSIGRCAQ